MLILSFLGHIVSVSGVNWRSFLYTYLAILSTNMKGFLKKKLLFFGKTMCSDQPKCDENISILEILLSTEKSKT